MAASCSNLVGVRLCNRDHHKFVRNLTILSMTAAPVSVTTGPAKRRRRSNSPAAIASNAGGSLPKFSIVAAPASTTAAPAKRRKRRSKSAQKWSSVSELLFPLVAIAGMAVVVVHTEYSISLRTPLRLGWQWPAIFSPRIVGEETRPAVSPRIEEGKIQVDQFGHKLTAFQQYACNKFGSACGVALAIQRAENPRGDCEIYHYNTDGTLDWGYFQINTVHLKRPEVNLRAMLNWRANIDFAYQLYTERGFQPWTTYRNGVYPQFLGNFEPRHRVGLTRSSRLPDDAT